MGSEGNFHYSRINAGFVFDPQPLGSSLLHFPDPEPPKPYPTPDLLPLYRKTPPRWLTEGLFWVLAHTVDAIETFGNRLGATYDQELEPLLNEWRERNE